MEYTMLNNGVKMPLLGFGVYMMTDLEECEKSVLHAIETGYRLLDTSSAYFNEEAVGRAIKKAASRARSCLSLPSCGFRTQDTRTPRPDLKHRSKNLAWIILTYTLSISHAGIVTALGAP